MAPDAGGEPTVAGTRAARTIPPPRWLAPAWTGPGSPAPVDVPLAGDPAYLGLSLFAQGLLVDPSGENRNGLTTAVELVLGL